MVLPPDGRDPEGSLSSSREGSISAPAAACREEPQLSQFSILEPIGSGLRGTVFRARTRSGRLVALKVFNRGVGIDAALLKRFAPSWTGVGAQKGSISHPNLVPIMAVGESDGRAFLAMPLLRGDSLEGVLAELRAAGARAPHLSELGTGEDGHPRTGFFRKAVALLAEVAEGLDMVHRLGVIHGRLGPRNLILSPSGKLVVTDFGADFAGPQRGRVGSGVSHDLVTLPYRAPEQIEPLGEPVDGRADVYALGAILYHLLTRSPPFTGRNPRDMREAILEGRFAPPTALEPRVTQEAEAVVLRAMALDPLERYLTALDLARDLRRLLRLESTEAVRAAPVAAAPAAAALSAPTPSPAAPPPPGPSVEEPVAAPAVEALPPDVPDDEAAAGPRLQGIAAPAEGGPVEPALPQAASRKPPVEASPASNRQPQTASRQPPYLPPLEGITGTPAESPASEPLPAAPFRPLSPFRPLGTGRRPLRARQVLARCLAASLTLAALGAWGWLTLFLHDWGEAARVGAARNARGLEHLSRAAAALFVEDHRTAALEVAATRTLGVAPQALGAVEEALEEAGSDTLRRDLSHSRAVVRREAAAFLRGAVERGERPPGDLALLQGSLGDEDAGVRQEAMAALARAGSSLPLLAAYPLGPGKPLLTLDAPTFLSLLDALAEAGDGAAEAVLSAWTLDDLARLDALEEGEAGVLEPNLRVEAGPVEGRRFAAAWVGTLARRRSGELLILAERLERMERRLLPLAGEVLTALAARGGGEARAALGRLFAPLALSHGTRIIDLLAGLAAGAELLAIARSSSPSPLRARAAEAAGALMVAGSQGVARGPLEDGLLALVSRDPELEVRRAALEAALEAPEPLASRAAGAALEDPLLRARALQFLGRRPSAAALPVLLEALKHGDRETRLAAARAIGATKDQAALDPLALLLHESDAEGSAAALLALREISPAQALRRAAGILPQGTTAVRELALEVLRCPPEPEPPLGVQALAVRVALGFPGADDPSRRLVEACRAHLREDLPGEDESPAPEPPPRATAGSPGPGALR